MLLDHTAPQRKLFGILCALSMLLISMPVANGDRRKSAPNSRLLHFTQARLIWTERLRRSG